ncbi:PilZ domain-containing protein [Thermodesulforhabdus norvegica]|uniref:PilZ domain-containing protein n=1 Tax=Thermodesulforhabdus norvegica TaxID=39841 RepID=A0A1I4SPG1_9BACT|nr:PilZ domain-containing protein [Thermodesulforhabdus norvegica]SFM66322.1 PilZ domain-containing protein [Thermodesulforhabdus norvegica]
MEQKDRRRFSRVRFQAEAVVSLRPHNVTTTGRIRDLSLKGMYVSTEKSFPQGSGVDVTILARTPAAELTLKLDGRVLRSEPEGMALEFSKMDLDTFIHLKNIIALNSGDLDKVVKEFHDFIKNKTRGQAQ